MIPIRDLESTPTMPGERPPLPLLGALLEPVYRAGVARRNRGFDAGDRVTRVAAPVICVGNISVGGTGKTPMVRWVVNALRELGASPAIAMRGYGTRHAGISDEQQEHMDRLPGIPIVPNPDRVVGARELIERHGVDCIVLDDGFQHRFLARDLDIVLVDATRPAYADRCLPAGWLREPVGSLARAGVIVVTRCSGVPVEALRRLTDRLAHDFPNTAILHADHGWSALQTVDATLPVSWLRGRPAFIACAIGNPGAFLAQSREHGVRVVGTLVKRDHHAWSGRDARRLLSMGVARKGALLTTHKDWVKFRRLGDERLNSAGVYPVVEMSFSEDHAGVLRDALARVVNYHKLAVP